MTEAREPTTAAKVCECGRPKYYTSKQCRRCFTANPKTTDVCHCGKPKRHSSKQCMSCRKEGYAAGLSKQDKSRAINYRRNFDMSIDDYELLLAFQDGVCAICSRPPKTIRLAVDHDHKTGHVRGLLCGNCNRTLHERLTIAWLESAYDYLDTPPAPAALGRQPVGRKGRVSSKTRRKKRVDTRSNKVI